MKRILFFLILICGAQYSFSQSLTPQIISSSGNSFTNGSSQLDWTLGEPTTSTFSDGTNLLTQGFHQDNLNVTSVDDFDINYGITIFPNPTIDLVQIQFEKANENNLIELYAVDGKLLFSLSSDNKSVCQIDMRKYDSGTYLVKLYNKNSKGKSYRIVKLK